MRCLRMLIGIIFFSGCVGGVWVREGKTSREAREDYFVCEDAALKDGAAVSSTEIQSRVDKCMEDKGYRRR